MLLKLSVDKILMKAKSHAKKNEFSAAQKLYESILHKFPNNIRAKEGLASLYKFNQNSSSQNPPQELVDQLIKLYDQDKFSTVVEKAKSLTRQYPEAFIVWNILGASTAQIGMLNEAVEVYNKTLSLKPDYAEGYNNLGNVLKDQGKLDEAIDAYNKALSINPNNVDAYYNMGVVLKDQCKLDEAIDAYKKTVYLEPNYADAYYNMGIVFKNQGKLDEAIEAYNSSISLKPNYIKAYNNIGNALQDQGKLNEAIGSFNKAISLKSDYAEAHKNLSYALLNSGKLREGFDENEWRWKTNKFITQQRHFLQFLWDGTKSLNGKRILLWSEQGVGDTIMWSSCLSLVSSQAEHCILECQEKLVPLLERSFPNVEVKAVNKNLDSKRDDFDFHLPMGSLYKYFINEITQNVKPDAYLTPDPIRVDFWRKRLNSLGNGPYVGISWKSSDMSSTRLPNYASISDLFPILSVPDITFINLQYVDFRKDLNKIKDKIGVTVHNFDDLDHYDNIDDVAALCAALDMIVSTKTTVPLISAGVGTPTKIANWRQSSWNNILHNPVGPSVEIFEKDTYEPWDNVFNLIAEDIFKTTKNWSS